MNAAFNPDMLVLAREVRGVTQTGLAEMTGIPQSNISKYETGLRDVKPKDLTAIGEALGFPARFFFRDGYMRAVESASVFHRKRQSILKSSLARLDALVNLLRLDADRLFRAADVEFGLVIPQYNLAKYDSDVEQVAAMVRAAWDIPSGPAHHLVKYMEAAGCVIVLAPFETDKMDAISQWKDPYPPVMLMSDTISGERQRFSLAHELGHLVMHRGIEPYLEMEAEADRFAAAFLMPADTIAPELPPVSIEHMIQIKSSWRVSVQALIRRSRDLDVISERQYKTLFEQLSRMGYRTREPFPLPAEQPTLLSNLLTFLQKELDHSPQDIADLLSINVEDLERRYIYKQQGLRLVKKQGKRNGTKPAGRSGIL